MVTVCKEIRFSAAHRLHTPSLSDLENTRLYGKCVADHGHNYRLIVCFRGEPDPITGMFIHLSELKNELESLIVAKLDHAHLNNLDEFVNQVPTLEVLAGWIWSVIAGKYGTLLCEIQLYETEFTFARISAGDL